MRKTFLHFMDEIWLIGEILRSMTFPLFTYLTPLQYLDSIIVEAEEAKKTHVSVSCHPFFVSCSKCMKNALAKQGKSSSSIHGSFDEFELVHISLDGSIIDRPG